MRRSLALLLVLVVAGCTGARGAATPASVTGSPVGPTAPGATRAVSSAPGATPEPSSAPDATPAASSAPDATTAPSSGPASLVDIGAGLQGPAGLTATVIATGLPNAAAVAYDADGRLWVATAAFSDDGSDAVYLVESPGVTPRAIVTDIHTPLGLAWGGGTLYVASAARIDAFSGFADGTFATRRTVVTLPDGVGEVNGLAIDPDGRLVVGVSAPCDACTPGSDDAAAVLSLRPDGSDLEVVASGIRAPVGLAYIPGTGDLLVTMNQRDDLGDATPGDWLGLVRSGQAWGFPDCYGQGGDPCAGVPAPVAVLDKHAAVSGLAVVTGGFGPVAGASAFVAEWATGLVLRVALTRTADGSAWTGTVEPFLTGVSRPVPVAIAPDGSIVVGDWDTGTVYRIAAS
jgi:glucose/arabinose dehydrogenase